MARAIEADDRNEISVADTWLYVPLSGSLALAALLVARSGR
jgi:hypothetical protein